MKKQISIKDTPVSRWWANYKKRYFKVFGWALIVLGLPCLIFLPLGIALIISGIVVLYLRKRMEVRNG